MIGAASLPSHLLTFLTVNPPFGKGSVGDEPVITFVKKVLTFSLLNADLIVA